MSALGDERKKSVHYAAEPVSTETIEVQNRMSSRNRNTPKKEPIKRSVELLMVSWFDPGSLDKCLTFKLLRYE